MLDNDFQESFIIFYSNYKSCFYWGCDEM